MSSGNGLKHGSDTAALHSQSPRPIKHRPPTLPAHAPKASEAVDSNIHFLEDVNHTNMPIAVGEIFLQHQGLQSADLKIAD
jgi:hypothetical protein